MKINKMLKITNIKTVINGRYLGSRTCLDGSSYFPKSVPDGNVTHKSPFRVILLNFACRTCHLLTKEEFSTCQVSLVCCLIFHRSSTVANIYPRVCFFFISFLFLFPFCFYHTSLVNPVLCKGNAAPCQAWERTKTEVSVPSSTALNGKVGWRRNWLTHDSLAKNTNTINLWGPFGREF